MSLLNTCTTTKPRRIGVMGDLLSDITSQLTLEDAMMHVNHFLL
uniref:Uncharacterized protein n=1 Tax=Glycine max TaxID=3847 RepID=A0A0R0FD64_SOYBN